MDANAKNQDIEATAVNNEEAANIAEDKHKPYKGYVWSGALLTLVAWVVLSLSALASMSFAGAGMVLSAIGYHNGKGHGAARNWAMASMVTGGVLMVDVLLFWFITRTKG